jgi:hypothetical protein
MVVEKERARKTECRRKRNRKIVAKKEREQNIDRRE